MGPRIVTRKDMWAGVNRCVVCGSKLRFAPSTVPDSRPEEGIKSCAKNHAVFQVYGVYSDDGWHVTFYLPIRSKANT